jgi:hypothetical protein
MTPKEKAHELFEKMALHICNTDAQECALIAIDEMIELCESYVTPYYQEVKKELEQILEDGFSRGV